MKIGLAVISLTTLTSLTNAAIASTYFGAGLGYSKLSTSKEFLKKGEKEKFYNQPRKFLHHSNKLGGQVFVGYNLNDYMGIEAGVSRYAKSTNQTQTKLPANFKASEDFNIRTVYLEGKIYLPLGQTGLNVYGLGGMALVNSKRNNSNVNALVVPVAQNQSKTLNKLRPKYGAGFSYDVPRVNLTSSVEWSRVQGQGNVKNSIKAIPNAEMTTVNFYYNF